MTTYLGKSCSFGLPRVPFVNCRQFMYLVISLLVLRAGCIYKSNRPGPFKAVAGLSSVI